MKRFLLFLFILVSFNSKAQVEVDTMYKLKAKLTKSLPLTPGCGYIAWALVQKFEIISSDYPNYNKKYILIIQPCPELLGKKFFQKNNIYEIDVANKSGAGFDFVIMNNYKNETTLLLWSRKISKL